MTAKLSKNQYFVFASLFLGICGSVFQKEFLTARSLTETALIIFSLSYLSSKYYASKIIQKYHQTHYKPGKARKFRDSVIIESTFHIIIPISLSLLYACCFLFILKYLPLSLYKSVGNLITPIIEFNKQYIKYPLVLLTTILAILTLTRYLSVKKYKSFRKTSKYITAPFKVIVVLTFFLAQDKGINNNLLEYHFNSTPVTSEFVTLNANTEINNFADEKIEKALNEYTSYVIEKLNDQQSPTEADDNRREFILPNAYKLLSFVKQFSNIKSNVSENIKLHTSYNIGSNSKKFDDYHETIWNYTPEKSKSSNLYEDALKKQPSFFDDFIATIADERKNIKTHILTENAEIIQQLMGDLILSGRDIIIINFNFDLITLY